MGKRSISCAVTALWHELLLHCPLQKENFSNVKNFVLRLYLIFYELQSELYKAVKIFLVSLQKYVKGQIIVVTHSYQNQRWGLRNRFSASFFPSTICCKSFFNLKVDLLSGGLRWSHDLTDCCEAGSDLPVVLYKWYRRQRMGYSNCADGVCTVSNRDRPRSIHDQRENFNLNVR